MADFERIIDYLLPTDQRNELVNEAVTWGPDGQTINLSNFQFLETNKLQGINIQIPFKNSADIGYFSMNTNYFDAAVANIRILLNTLPEERVVTGVGSNIKRYLFEPRTREWEDLLQNEIKTSILAYMPQLEIKSLKIISQDSKGNPNQIKIAPMAEHEINIEIKFGFKIAPESSHTGNVRING